MASTSTANQWHPQFIGLGTSYLHMWKKYPNIYFILIELTDAKNLVVFLQLYQKSEITKVFFVTLNFNLKYNFLK